jgi:hypothetical protein
MVQFTQNIPAYLVKVIISTLTQLIILLGPIILLALLMNIVSRQNEKLSYLVLGQKGYLYLFGWLGTAVHEIGHAFFAIIFGHKIDEIVLFSPDHLTGSLGHVRHSYNPNSIYQNIGNFFIGIGPVIFGSIILFLISFILFGYNFKNINLTELNSGSFSGISSFKDIGSNILDNISNYFRHLFTGPGTAWWKILLMIYLLYSIGSSITLSKSDVTGAFTGFIFFVVVLFAFNLATLWMGSFTINAFYQANNYFSILYFLIILSLIINIIFIFVLILVHFIKLLIISNFIKK